MILTPDSSNVHNVAQIPESTTHHQYTDISSISSSQREPTLNLGKLSCLFERVKLVVFD